MNYSMIRSTVGKILQVEGVLMVLPLLVSVIYRERDWVSFAIVAGLLVAIGLVLNIKKPNDKVIRESEGFIIVALSWILASAFGALPFYISGQIPSYIDSFFEAVSGFTTTGSSILQDVEALSQGMLFWRGFTIWIGGMGIIVFVLAVLSKSEGRSIHIMRAEVPGPVVGKIVSKIKVGAMILYGIYIALTIIQILFLLVGGMPLFDSIVNTFATAGTGGFAIKNASIGAYNSAYFEYVIAVFMVLFGVNFNIYFLIITGHLVQALRSEELRVYLGIVVAATAAICINIMGMYDSAADVIRDAFFSVSTVMTTTGFVTANFDLWPSFSKTILVILMFVGASAGSTGGGLKVARVIIMKKTVSKEIKRLLHPRSVVAVKAEGKTLEDSVVRSTGVYFITYMSIFTLSLLLVSLDGMDLITDFTAVASCFNNIGPGLGAVGPVGNFSAYSAFTKFVLSLTMLFGRLEIYPMIMLFLPSVWKRR